MVNVSQHSHFKRHFEKVKANAINRSKKKLLHHFGSRRFFYRMEERYTLIEAFAVPDQDAGLRIMTDTLDQSLSHRPRKIYRGMGNAHHHETASSSSTSMGLVAILMMQVVKLEQ
ncbi:hypothetical protein D8674_030966 [Pyrus ussuriensis x Pyrus communis]|uniref:Uncharacterized protein n=1 Tax=Pyrus ussuriensis x Pyrus communis TaxID=2448454 RepID=A0A5N5EXI4_9ROSA|nr:hypothetical protein D8674_030966 [Pyrus ussuriensis x Pyrus communis]